MTCHGSHRQEATKPHYMFDILCWVTSCILMILFHVSFVESEFVLFPYPDCQLLEESGEITYFSCAFCSCQHSTGHVEIAYQTLLLLLLLSCFRRVQLCATPQMAAHQAPLSLGFSRQEYWHGLPIPSPVHACMLSRFSRVWLCATPWTAALQAPLSTGFSRQEYWSGLPFPSPKYC